jgi:hypothetical protein
MKVEEMARFQVDLEELAAKHGLELVETPAMTYGPAGINVEKSGSALWPCYDAKGALTCDFAIRFHPKP